MSSKRNTREEANALSQPRTNPPNTTRMPQERFKAEAPLNLAVSVERDSTLLSPPNAIRHNYPSS